MKLIRIILITVLFSVLFQSCAPTYMPNVLSNPDLRQSGDITISGYYGSAGVDIKTSFAVSNHVGILLGGNFDHSDGDVSHSHGFFEVGGGYFDKKTPHFSWAVYGGVGTGNYNTTIRIRAPYADGIYKTQYEVVRYFLQPSATYHSQIGEIGLACRMDALHVSGTQDIGPAHCLDHTFPMIEPSLNIKVGKGNWRIALQGGFSIHLANESLHYLPGIIAMGVQLKLNAKPKK